MEKRKQNAKFCIISNAQDTSCIMENYHKDMTYMAVYDGHGTYGRIASDLANNSIKEYLEEYKDALFKLDGEEDLSKFFKEMYKKVQNKFKEDVSALINKIVQKNDFQLSGTCAVSILLKDNTVYTANLGDSRAVIGSCSKDETCALEISIDHKPTRPEEKDRIMASGGKIERSMVDDKEVGPYRVWKSDEDVPGIAITRSLGDLIAHEIGVSAEPEVTCKDIDNEDKFIVMGSDGVWDVMSSAEAVGFILSVPIADKETAAEKMVAECRERWDLLNEIKRKQAQIMLDSSETNKKAAAERKNELERNIACDDITVAVHYLMAFEEA